MPEKPAQQLQAMTSKGEGSGGGHGESKKAGRSLIGSVSRKHMKVLNNAIDKAAVGAVGGVSPVDSPTSNIDKKLADTSEVEVGACVQPERERNCRPHGASVLLERGGEDGGLVDHLVSQSAADGSKLAGDNLGPEG